MRYLKLTFAFACMAMVLLIGAQAMACTIFVFTHNGKTWFCNNEDWRDPVTEIRFHPAKDGHYAWVYFGFSNDWAQGGVNEHGLCFDWYATGGPFGWKSDAIKQNFDGNLSEELLRKCKNVDEAIEFYQKYNEKNLDVAVTLIADKDGNSVLVHWKDGKLVLEKNQNSFLSCGVGKAAVDAKLQKMKGEFGMEVLAEALREGSSEGEFATQYSNIVSLSDGKIYLFQQRDYNRYLEIDFGRKLKEPAATYRIADLFSATVAVPGVEVKQGVLVESTDNLSNEMKQQIDTIFSEYDREDSPGAAISVISRGEVVFQKGYGCANLEHRIPIDPTTSVFNSASVSKQITAFAIQLLADQKKLSLGDDICKYIPELNGLGKAMTLRQLANHTSGLRNDISLLAMAGWTPGDAISTSNILEVTYRQKELNFVPGENFSYSNSGYNLLAEVVTRVSGQTFAEFSREHIFEPLQMNDSFFIESHRNLIPNIAYAYRGSGSVRFADNANDGYSGSSGFFTTAADLSKWVLNLGHPKVGNASLVEQMCTAGVLNDGSSCGYGLGLFVEKHKGLKLLQHSGATGGYTSYCGMFPEQDFAVVLLSNSSSINPIDKSLEVADLFLAPFLGQVDLTKSEPPNAAGSIELPVANLEQFTGSYWNNCDTFATVSVNDGSLIYTTGGNEMELVPVGNSEFQLNGAGSETMATFRLDDQDEATMRIKAGHKDVDLFHRYDQHEYSAAELQQFVGQFYSEELDASYSLQISEGDLTASHLRIGTIQLTPINLDNFRSHSWRFSVLKFLRNREGAVDGFRINSALARNIHFAKVTQREKVAGSVGELVNAGIATQDKNPQSPEYDAIRQTLTDYIEGSTNGQPDRLRKVFHPDLNLYSVGGDGRLKTWSGSDYIGDTKEGKPTGETGRILSIDFENDIGVAKVEISSPNSSTPYIDYFMLLKIEGKWTIVHKMYTRKSNLKN